MGLAWKMTGCIALACMMSATLLGGCMGSSQAGDAPASAVEKKVENGAAFSETGTVGDYVDLSNDTATWGFGDGLLEYSHRDASGYVRVRASLDDEHMSALSETGYGPEALSAVSDVPVDDVTRLSVLDDGVLDGYVGKDCSEMLADGFSLEEGTAVDNDGETWCLVERDGVDYLAILTGDASQLADMTVTSLSVEGIAYANAG